MRAALCAVAALLICCPPAKTPYRCPPCNQPCDGETFHGPGQCPHCRMALVPGEPDRQVPLTALAGHRGRGWAA